MNERRFSPSQAHKLDAPERKTWLPVADVLRVLELRPGEIVADIGAGTGYFALPIAEAVGIDGEVFAVDVEPEMLSHIQTKLAALLAAKVECKVGEASATGLAARSCDLVLLANIWHELEDANAVLDEVHRILKRGGRVAILDWRADVEQPPGPPISHRIAQNSVEAALTASGIRVRAGSRIGRFSYIVVGVNTDVREEGKRVTEEESAP